MLNPASAEARRDLIVAFHGAEVWGRPAALAVAKDGALLIADDTGGTIWRIAYSGPKQQTEQQPGTTTGGAPK